MPRPKDINLKYEWINITSHVLTLLNETCTKIYYSKEKNMFRRVKWNNKDNFKTPMWITKYYKECVNTGDFNAGYEQLRFVSEFTEYFDLFTVISIFYQWKNKLMASVGLVKALQHETK